MESENGATDFSHTRGKITQTIGEVTFNSNFDSGNLDRVEQCPSTTPNVLEYNLWTAPDCAGLAGQNGNRSWFYYSITTPTALCGMTIRMNIVNMNKQMRLYLQGLSPITRTVPGRGTWDRLRDRPECQVSEEGMKVSFNYTHSEQRKVTTFFAFCFPFSYGDCQRYLSKVERRVAVNMEAPEAIYYHRELLCYSLDHLHIDLLTVSSHHDITMENEPRLPGLFPDEGTARARIFNNKKVIIVTSRVHPGETPASFVFNGFLEFILREDDPRAKLLRRHFVFKMVPLLNPDGVQRGHYRTDSRGVNLNRVYLDPQWALHPSIYAVKCLTLYHHQGLIAGAPPFTADVLPPTPSREVNQMDSFLNSRSTGSGVGVYVDLHAHATKRGCFMYGNHFEREDDQVECMLLPRLLSLNSLHFDFDHCVFSESNMYTADRRDGKATTKEGSGRVALHKATGLIHCYTLECNYNSGRHTNTLSPATMDSGKATPPQDGSPIPYKYSINSFEEVGRGLAAAILDLYQMNPWSRLPTSCLPSLSEVRHSLLEKVRNTRAKQAALKKKKSGNKVMVQEDHPITTTSGAIGGSSTSNDTIASIAMSHLVLRQSGTNDTNVGSNDYPRVKAHRSYQTTSTVLPALDIPHKLKLEALSDSVMTKKSAIPDLPTHPHSAKGHTTPTKLNTSLKWMKPSLLSFNLRTKDGFPGKSADEFAIIGHQLKTDMMVSDSHLFDGFTTSSGRLMLDLRSDVERTLSLPLYTTERSIKERGGALHKPRRQRLPRIKTAKGRKKSLSSRSAIGGAAPVHTRHLSSPAAMVTGSKMLKK